MDRAHCLARSPALIRRWRPNRLRSTASSTSRLASRIWWTSQAWLGLSPWPWKVIQPQCFVTDKPDRGKLTPSPVHPIWYGVYISLFSFVICCHKTNHRYGKRNWVKSKLYFMGSSLFCQTFAVRAVPRPAGPFLGRTRSHLPGICPPLRPLEREGQAVGLHLRYQSFIPGNLQRKGWKNFSCLLLLLSPVTPIYNPSITQNGRLRDRDWVQRVGGEKTSFFFSLRLYSTRLAFRTTVSAYTTSITSQVVVVIIGLSACCAPTIDKNKWEGTLSSKLYHSRSREIIRFDDVYLFRWLTCSI